MKSSNKLIMYSFLAIIYIVLMMYLVHYFLVYKGIINLDNPQIATISHDGGLKAKINNIKNNIETKTINYFPMYNKINYLSKDAYVKSNSYIYNLLDKDFLNVGKNYDNEYIYKNIKDDYYILKSQYNEDELQKRIDNEIRFYNYLDKEDIDLYIYLPNRYEFNHSSYLDTKDMNSFITYFKNNLNKGIKIGELDSSDGYYNYFYKTDQHWNGYGALKGYKDIMSMMNMKSYNYEVKKLDGIKIRGSIAKSAGDNSITEDFYYIDSKMDCNVNIDGRFKPMSVENNKDPFYDYYVAFYYGMYGEVSYNCSNSSNENLLIIGDSYSWSIDYLLAKHFNNTYLISLRFLNQFV